MDVNAMVGEVHQAYGRVIAGLAQELAEAKTMLGMRDRTIERLSELLQEQARVNGGLVPRLDGVTQNGDGALAAAVPGD
jgi:hypothetical protein